MPAPILPASLPLSAAAASSLTTAAGAATSAASASGPSPFANVLNQAIQQVESFQTNASDSVNRFLSGEGEEIHKVALATQQADLSFQLFMQVRNKVIAAYQQVMQMQV
jgi:flagellar hook-basal body complex protein FliE